MKHEVNVTEISDDELQRRYKATSTSASQDSKIRNQVYEGEIKRRGLRLFLHTLCWGSNKRGLKGRNF